MLLSLSETGIIKLSLFDFHLQVTMVGVNEGFRILAGGKAKYR